MRPVIGIDLGTTHTAVAHARPEGDGWSAPALFAIPQLVRPADVKARPSLPSHVYLSAPGDLPEGALELPFAPGQDFMVGEAARDRGAEIPTRSVGSSKSWLCHGGADREGDILPPEGLGEDPEIDRISPVEAARRILEHVRRAWDHAHPDAPTADHEVLITVPASFDVVARALTTKAAELAGFAEVTLLEEPQAAFYAWLSQVQDAFTDQLSVGDRILVCDVGGGTSDFSLIAVTEDEGGKLQLERVAVGDHLLLGGDNMDLALGHLLHQQLAAQGKKLDAAQQRALVASARRAKEALLSDPEPKEQTITVLGRGRSLFGGKLTVTLTREAVEQVVLDGFFPVTDKDEMPQDRKRAGFLELGLPYASDAAITRHLARFLAERADAPPTHLLFNGGVFNAPALRRRVIEVLERWGRHPAVLEGADNDLAVARGAAWYGAVRAGGGLKIRGGASRSYWVGVEVAMPAVPGLPPPMRAICVVPFGMDEGTEAEVAGQTLGLVVGEPTEFAFFSSTRRDEDPVGAVLDEFTWPEHLEPTAPVSTTLTAEDLEPGTVVPVKLHAKLNELGTLELWCQSVDDDRRFRLEFDVRQTD